MYVQYLYVSNNIRFLLGQVNSKQGHTVITMLLDVNGFWRYDNRESILAGGGGGGQSTYPDDEENIF